MSTWTMRCTPTELRKATRSALRQNKITPEEAESILKSLRGLKSSGYVSTDYDFSAFRRCPGSCAVLDEVNALWDYEHGII